MQTDYKHGDPPLPVGTEVDYQGSVQQGVWKVIAHTDPADHPDLRYWQAKHPEAAEELEAEFVENYPDGVGYSIWPVAVPYKFGLRHLEVRSARRTSLRVITKGNDPC